MLCIRGFDPCRCACNNVSSPHDASEPRSSMMRRVSVQLTGSESGSGQDSMRRCTTARLVICTRKDGNDLTEKIYDENKQTNTKPSTDSVVGRSSVGAVQ